MKESPRKDLASYSDPESRVGAREDAGEALTGSHAGQPLSCEIPQSGNADAVFRSRRQHRVERQGKLRSGSRAVEDPAHAWKLLAREPGGPASARRRWSDGPVGEGLWPHARHVREQEVGRLRNT